MIAICSLVVLLALTTLLLLRLQHRLFSTTTTKGMVMVVLLWRVKHGDQMLEEALVKCTLRLRIPSLCPVLVVMERASLAARYEVGLETQ